MAQASVVMVRHAGLTLGCYSKINPGTVATTGTLRPAHLCYQTHTRQPGYYHYTHPKTHMYDRSKHVIIRRHEGRESRCQGP